jgi:hypothetical protein
MDDQLIEQLRRALPRLVRERPEIAAEIQIRLREAFASKDDLRAVIEAMDRRFEESRAESDRRFAEARAESDRRFAEARAESDRRFEELRADMNRRFEAMDRRFEALQADMDRRFEAVDRRFEAMDRRFDRLEGRLDLGLLGMGRFAERLGHRMEDLIAGALRFALQRPEIQPDRVRVRQVFVDEDGRLGRKGRRAEMDVVAADGRTYLVEAKSSADRDDVQALADKAEFVARMMGLEPGTYEIVLATLDKSEETRDACEGLGIVLV